MLSLVHARHEASNRCEGGLQSAPIRNRGLLLANIGTSTLNALAAFDLERGLAVSQLGWQSTKPLQNLDIVIAHVASVAEKARGS